MVIRKSKRPIYHCFFGLDDAIGGALLGGVMDIAGGIFSANMQNSATEAMQQRNIDWEREQLQNKHQWEVEDLRKAGLNPILSASNSSSAVSAGSPQGANPNIQLSKTLEALSNSALMKKETELKQFALDTERMKAEADMIIAKHKENLTPSAIELNQTQADLNLTNIWRLNKLVPLEEAYSKANVDYTVQKMINSIIEVNARAQYLEKAGDAQLMIGSAAQSQAAAAHRQADISQQIAWTMEKNGVSEREVNKWKAGEYEQQIKESVARTDKILTEDKQLNFTLRKDMLHNPNYRRTGGGNWFTDAVYGTGEYLRELNPLRGMFGN